MSFEMGLMLKPVVVLAFVGLLSLLLRRASAATLHGIWALGMISVLALPLAAVVLPAIDLPVLPERTPDPLLIQQAPVVVAPAASTPLIAIPMESVQRTTAT